MPFVTQYNPSAPNLKNVSVSKWRVLKNQPLLREIYREPPFISYMKRKSLKDILVKANSKRSQTLTSRNSESRVKPVNPLFTSLHLQNIPMQDLKTIIQVCDLYLSHVLYRAFREQNSRKPNQFSATHHATTSLRKRFLDHCFLRLFPNGWKGTFL